jgi:hypothetical protein
LWKATAQDFFRDQMPEIPAAPFFEKLCAHEVFSKSTTLSEIKNYLLEDTI